MSITINIEKVGDWEKLTFTGPINEDSEVYLTPVIAQLSNQVIFNFKDVSYVNSCGVRAWINFLREAEQNRQVIFEECTPEIVSQINMIPNFKGTAAVKSVYASYGCDDCGNTAWMLFEEGNNLPSSSDCEAPEKTCEKCGAEMEMEELEDEFFSWLDAS